MQITFTPMRRDDTLTLHRAGDVLTLNGAACDLSAVAEGAVVPATTFGCPWLVSDVTRTDGRLHLTLILPHGPSAPPETLFPEPVLVAADGPVLLPPY